MNAQMLASLGFKLAGIFAVVHTAPLLQSAILLPGVRLALPEEVPLNLYILANLSPLVALLGLGGYLFFRSDSLASRYFQQGDTVAPLQAREMQTAALSVTGVILIILAVRHLGPAALSVAMLANQDDPFQIANNEWQRTQLTRYLADTWGHLLAQVLTLTAGIVLVRKSGVIASRLVETESE